MKTLQNVCCYLLGIMDEFTLYLNIEKEKEKEKTITRMSAG